MRRVHVIWEGQTELTFVRELLQPALPGLHLIGFLPGKKFGRQRGGDIRYARVKPDILNTLKSDAACCCTTFLDYYGLGEFPSNDQPHGSEPEHKAARIEQAVAADIAQELGTSFDSRRFYPYLSLHEFEALLFSDPSRLASGLYQPALAPALQTVRTSFETPEHIDDGVEAAPSKRLKKVCDRYDKVTGGNLAALEVGVDAMKRECGHFARWFEWLESRQAQLR